jgi:hypothetical protein
MLRFFALIVTFYMMLIPNILVASEPTTMNRKNECVILLHGIGDSKSSMEKIEAYLLEKGYRVVNFTYPSTSESIEHIADAYIPEAISQCRVNPTGKIHFVTHSLGGIIARQYLQSNALPEGSRFVMLAPPNQGSEIVDYVKGLFLYEWTHGPAGQELGTDPESTPNKLQPVKVEVGIIAGGKSINPLFSAFIPGPDDGRVSIQHTTLEEMDDFVVIPSSHSFIVNNSSALKQVAHFLEYGKFDHSEEDSKPGPKDIIE